MTRLYNYGLDIEYIQGDKYSRRCIIKIPHEQESRDYTLVHI